MYMLVYLFKGLVVVPPPTPDCDGIAVTCLNTQLKDQPNIWDKEYGGISDGVCR